MIQVTTGSRLHFGLLALPREGSTCWPNVAGEAAVPARQFGGVGLMIQEPRLVLKVEEATAWTAAGPLAERALEYARLYVRNARAELRPQRLIVESAPPEHRGLGAGTQLALTVAAALAAVQGTAAADTATVAALVGRGGRSGIGTHGFAHGGFLVDAGKGPFSVVAPLIARTTFPEEWALLLIVPDAPAGLHGEAERAAFHRLNGETLPDADTDVLCRLVLTGLLPALLERDFECFSEALFDFNARVGRAFARIQGGPYANPVTAEIIAFLRGDGVRGVGQSSWGPTVFAVLPDAGTAELLAARVQMRLAATTGRVLVTTARNEAASVAM
jgi:beta-ribofuranosylaminobenzene 5'-phosphate synthase